MALPHPPQEAWIGRAVLSPVDRYHWRDGLWRVERIETREGEIRLLLRKNRREVWTEWRPNHWAREGV